MISIVDITDDESGGAFNKRLPERHAKSIKSFRVGNLGRTASKAASQKSG
jgi:hypothetical protein